MTKRMLIDGINPEQTRVVIMDGNTLLDFDTEIASQRTLKGNIYLAKITRVEPSLQAAFVDYGGNRHGFLPFSEIHPDYYRIPVADREALKASMRKQRSSRDDEDDIDDDEDGSVSDLEETDDQDVMDAADNAQNDDRDDDQDDDSGSDGDDETALNVAEELPPLELAAEASGQEVAPEAAQPEPSAETVAEPQREAGGASTVAEEMPATDGEEPSSIALAAEVDPTTSIEVGAVGESVVVEAADVTMATETPATEARVMDAPVASGAETAPASAIEAPAIELPPTDDVAVAPVEAVAEAPATEGPETESVVAELVEAEPSERRPNGRESRGRRNGRSSNGRSGGGNSRDGDRDGNSRSDDSNRRSSRSSRRAYTIQEVIKRGQIMLVQVVKEERGTKGAAVTSYLSLAGRYCVLMPNTARGGGISRKITSSKDRSKLKEIVESLDIEDSMAVIVRTAGIGRTKTEIKRDYDFLAKSWEQVRDETLQSRAPAVIYQESNLIKRTLRDSYSREVEEVLVQGDAAYREAKDFMKTLMPSHAKRVQPYRDVSPPLFHRYNVDAQLHKLHSQTVQLPSGGYLVIDLTEALVSIDINSGRATRERHIEETALKTNLEASDEIGRQLRLRDLAGLVVIDFIDMEDRRNNYAVERRLKDSLRGDRARVQVGRISPLGLMEMSRQRLRPSLLETSMEICPVCAGLGRVTSTPNSALQALSAIEDEGMRGRAGAIKVRIAGDVAFYILNEKRDELARIQRDYNMHCVFEPDSTLIPPNLRIEVMEGISAAIVEADVIEAEAVVEAPREPAAIEAPVADAVEEAPRRRGRRPAELPVDDIDEEDSNRRRRGRRAGRRRRRDEDGPVDEAAAQEAAPEAPQVAAQPSEPVDADDQDEVNDDRGRNKRRRRRRRGRGEGRAPLPGVATFLKGATPLAWHVATDETPAPKPLPAPKEAASEEVVEASAEAVVSPDLVHSDVGSQDFGSQDNTTADAPLEPIALPEAQVEPPEVALPEAGPAEATHAEAAPSEAAANDNAGDTTAPADTMASMIMPINLAMGKADEASAKKAAETSEAELRKSPEIEPQAKPEAAVEEVLEAPVIEPKAAPEPAEEPSAPLLDIAEPVPNRPRRGGWWQRLLD